MKSPLDSRYEIPEEVVYREIDGESVLLDLVSGEYYGLNEVGTRFWLLLVEHRQAGTVFEALRQEYEVDETELRGDLLGLLERLLEKGLVRIDGR